jgi:hypothetical protein
LIKQVICSFSLFYGVLNYLFLIVDPDIVSADSRFKSFDNFDNSVLECLKCYLTCFVSTMDDVNCFLDVFSKIVITFCYFFLELLHVGYDLVVDCVFEVVDIVEVTVIVPVGFRCLWLIHERFDDRFDDRF